MNCLLACVQIFLQPPENFSPKVEAALGFIVVEDKCLLLRRSPGTVAEGTWSFAGGKIENGETTEEALLRELKEETGLSIENPQSIANFYVRKPEKDLTLHIFLIELAHEPALELAIEENDTALWVTLEEGLSLPLINGPAGASILKKCFEYRKR